MRLTTSSVDGSRSPRGGDDGFTLIELLIVVVIIGILAAVAIPQFSSTKEDAYDAAAKSDLRNMMSAQEEHLFDYSNYASSTALLLTRTSFTGTSAVNVSMADDGSGGYWADASHENSSTCFRVQMGPAGDGEIERVPNASSGSGQCSG